MDTDSLRTLLRVWAAEQTEPLIGSTLHVTFTPEGPSLRLCTSMDKPISEALSVSRTGHLNTPTLVRKIIEKELCAPGDTWESVTLGRFLERFPTLQSFSNEEGAGDSCTAFVYAHLNRLQVPWT